MSDRDHILAGKHLLIIDDEPLLAYDLADLLGSHGASIVGPEHNIRDGLSCIEGYRGNIDCALLDIQIGSNPVWPIAQKLNSLKIPFFFISAQCGTQDLPDEFRGTPCLKKPVDKTLLQVTLNSILFG